MTRQAKVLKRKANKQGKDDGNKLIRSNSSTAIPVNYSSQDSQDSQDFSSQECSSRVDTNSQQQATCVSCCLDIDFTGEGRFTCDVCDNVYHDSCLNFDPTTLDAVHEVMKVYGWICADCRILAKTVKSSKFKGKCKNKTIAPVSNVDEHAMRRLLDEVGMLTKRITELESMMKEIRISSMARNMPVSKTVDRSTSGAIANANPPPDHTGPAPVRLDTATTVHRVMKDFERRKNNVIVSGLKPQPNVDDGSLFNLLCERHFSVGPLAVKCRRIDKPVSSSISGIKPSRLLVHLGSEKLASEILSQARQLRLSEDQDIRLNVYISRDMSPEESKLAYEERVRRRSRKSVPSKSPLQPNGDQLIASPSGAAILMPQDAAPSAFASSSTVPNINDSTHFPVLDSSGTFTNVYSGAQPLYCVQGQIQNVAPDRGGLDMFPMGTYVAHPAAFNNSSVHTNVTGAYLPQSSMHPGLQPASHLIPSPPVRIQPVAHHAPPIHPTPSLHASQGHFAPILANPGPSYSYSTMTVPSSSALPSSIAASSN